MPFPESLTLVTVNFQFDNPPSGGAFGAVRFTSPQALVGEDADSIVPPIDQIARIAADGSGSIRLPARNVTGWDPVDWAYTVTASVNGQTRISGTLVLEPDDTVVELSDRLQITSGSVIVPGVMYVTSAQLAAGLATKADLVHTHVMADVTGLVSALAGKAALVHVHDMADVTGLATALASKASLVHTHTIDQVSDLQPQLDGKLDVPPEPYITAADIANLVSYETLTESLTNYLPKVAPVVTDSTFTVVRTAGGAARWRATGSALDIDTVGDVVESSWSGAGFTGSQTGLRRMRAGSGNTLAGLTEFGSTPYTSEQAIDATTGVARLGAKNSAVNVRLCGYLDQSTAPTTGTWAVGDIVNTRVGQFRCTVAGTPGTWVWLTPSQAMEHGFAGWMADSANIQGSLIFSGGVPYVWRFRADAPTISAMNLHIVTPGTNLTNAFWTLHNDDGTALSGTAQSANQNTNLQTGGERTMPMTTQAVTPGQFYRARFWATTSGGALPTASRLCSSSNAALNTGGTLWYTSAAGGLTDLASAPSSIGALSSTVPTVAWWAAWKA